MASDVHVYRHGLPFGVEGSHINGKLLFPPSDGISNALIYVVMLNSIDIILAVGKTWRCV